MHTKKLLSLAAAALALAAAGPAAAADNTPKPPVDANGKKSCPIKDSQTKNIRWIPHGTTVVEEFTDGDRQKKKCEDGTWTFIRRPGLPVVKQRVLTQAAGATISVVRRAPVKERRHTR